MEVTIQRTTIISHRNPKPDPLEIPLTIFDRFASNIHIAVLYAFSPPTPSNDDVIQALIQTLAYFPTLIGELATNCTGRPCLLLGSDGGGGLLVEATVASDLATHLPLAPSPYFALLHPPTPYDGAMKLFQVQLNRFKCGGLVIGVTAHHRVADGQSMSTFFVAWGKTVRGLPVNPLPVYEKPWLAPRTPPRYEFEHWGFEFLPTAQLQDGFSPNPKNIEPEKVTSILLRYSSDYLSSKLKASTMPVKYTTFETLMGHLWRKITIARQLDEREETMIRVSVNGRPRLTPPVPREFFGNLVLNAYPRANVRELIEGGTAGAARRVHEAVRRIDEEYFRSFIDFGAIHEEEELVPCYDVDGNVLSPNLEVDSWLGFRFHEVDFGGGGALCGFLPTWVPIDGLVMFVPTLREDGGIDVVVNLIKEHAVVLREISHSLD